jgi:serine/threonine protein kinase
MEVVELGALVLRGLGAVHRAAIVHRDLKPENIFLVEDGDGYLPKILDFGISRSVDPASGRESAHTTKEGLLVGTPDYMSPEQVRGLSDIDTRTDIYSMGVILYEAVAGRMPFESENVGDLMIMIAAGNAPESSQVAPWVPESLSKVIARAMSRQRDQRYQTTREMLEALIEVGYSLDLSKDVEITGPFKVLRSTIPPPPRNPDEIHIVAETVSRYHEEARRRESSSPPTAKPIHHHSPTALILTGAVAVLLGLGVAGALMFATSGDDAPAEAPPTTSASPQVIPATTDEVALESLPDGATIRVDDAVTSEPIVLVRDGEPHLIEVTHPEHEPWRVTHVASGPGEYEVEMVALFAEEPAVVEVIEAEVPAEAQRPRRRGRMRMAMNMDDAEGAEGPRTFRMLDY